jgi:phosphoribosylamine--glycine ligase
MGAYSPVPFVNDELVSDLVEAAVAPLVAALRARGIDYRGVLYAGLMLTADGPKVLEYNVRFGDPETQVVVPRLDGDLTALLAETAAGELRTVPRFTDDAAVCVVLASEGYPEAPRTGDVIVGHQGDGAARVLHAGTAAGGATGGSVVTSGGRVLGVVALGATIDEARTRAYARVSRIKWPGMHHRSDIAAPRWLTGSISASRSKAPETQEVAR